MNIKNLTADEQVDLEIEFVINKIIKSARYCSGQVKIEYRIYSPPDLVGEGMPFPIEEFKILELLKREGVIKQLNPDDGEVETTIVDLSSGLRKIICFVYLEKLAKFTEYIKTHMIKIYQIRAKQLGPDIYSHFNFIDAQFTLKLPDNSIASIDFHPKESESTAPQLLMGALVSYLKLYGARAGNRVESIVNIDYIKDYVRRHDNTVVVDSYWLKNTKGNLLKKIPGAYKSIILISNFDNKAQGYKISLPLPV